MTEIDTNPRGKSSQEFSQKLEEMERNNTQKKQGQITSKTIRRGKVKGVSEEKFETDSTGRVKMLDKRIIKYGEYQFPDQFLDDFHVMEGNQKIKI